MSTEQKLNSLKIKIASLWGSAEGTNVKYVLDAPTAFNPAELDAAGNVCADLMIIKLKEELSALLSDVSIDINTVCPRCLKKFVLEITIPNAEREFLAEKPRAVEDINDLFLIDMKAMTIDLNEMLRQEIILHFPPNALCSSGCKGLCAVCGKDRNKNKCKCVEADAETCRPFKNLKKIIRN